MPVMALDYEWVRRQGPIPEWGASHRPFNPHGLRPVETSREVEFNGVTRCDDMVRLSCHRWLPRRQT